MKRIGPLAGVAWCAVARSTHFAFQSVIDLLVEDACVICARRSDGHVECEDRFDRLLTRPVVVRHYRLVAIVNRPVCASCAREFVRTRSAGVLGSARGAQVTTASGDRFGPSAPAGDTATEIPVLAPFMTEDRVLKLVHQVKFSGYRGLGEVLGGAVAAEVAESVPDRFECVAPVPMAAADLRRRGYNLAAIVARMVAAEAHISLHSNMLEKQRRTRRQSQTPSEGRAANVRGAYRVAEFVRGKRVLVVDDLVTSGATAADCCAALLAAGAARVAVACIGRAL